MNSINNKDNIITQTGFTLVELVVVITVLGIIMAGTAVYITRSAESFNDQARREKLATVARLAIERITREIRNALPNSLRINSNAGTHCVEFFPIDRASAYLDIPNTAANISFTSAPFSAPSSGNRHVVIYPYSASVLYNEAFQEANGLDNIGPYANYNASGSNPGTGEVQLQSSHRFNFTSPQRRFFLVTDPVSFCIIGDQLLRYSNYAIQVAQPTPPANGVLLAQHLQLTDGASAVTPFNYDPGNPQRHAVLAMDFRFMQDNEWLRLSHEVQLRNVP